MILRNICFYPIPNHNKQKLSCYVNSFCPFHTVDNFGGYQAAQMRMLVCIFDHTHWFLMFTNINRFKDFLPLIRWNICYFRTFQYAGQFFMLLLSSKLTFLNILSGTLSESSSQAKGTKPTSFLTCVRNEVDLVRLVAKMYQSVISIQTG